MIQDKCKKNMNDLQYRNALENESSYKSSEDELKKNFTSTAPQSNLSVKFKVSLKQHGTAQAKHIFHAKQTFEKKLFNSTNLTFK